MKDSKTATTMRWVAGGLYAALSVYQMFANYTVLPATGIANSPYVWLASVGLILVAGAMAIWMFSSKDPIAPGAQRGVVVGTGLWVIFELITYRFQTAIISYALSELMPGLLNSESPNNIWLYVFIIIRLMLLILAAFFVTSSREPVEERVEKGPEAVPSKPLETPAAVGTGKKTTYVANKAKQDLDTPLDPTSTKSDKK